MKNSNISSIYKEVMKLPDEDQLLLISKIAHSLKIKKANSSHKLSELRGLGKEIWQKIDTEKYVHDIRKEWDER